jgi:hypothetical protein
MQQQSAHVSYTQTLTCSAKFSIFFSTPQKFAQLHIELRNEPDRITPPDISACLDDEILEDDIFHLYMDPEIHIHLDNRSQQRNTFLYLPKTFNTKKYFVLRDQN